MKVGVPLMSASMTNMDSLNCSAPFTKTAYTVVVGLSAVSAFISLLACCFIVFVIVLFKKWRYFSQHLLFYHGCSTACRQLPALSYFCITSQTADLIRQQCYTTLKLIQLHFHDCHEYCTTLNWPTL